MPPAAEGGATGSGGEKIGHRKDGGHEFADLVHPTCDTSPNR